MRPQIWNRLQEHLGLSLKCGSVLFLFLVSVLVVACGANNTASVPGSPPVTVTINLDQTFSSPTPPLREYSCGAWATESTPAYSAGGTVEVYAKFVHNVDGNPVGMGNANARAVFVWPSDPQTTVQANTTADGLAVFSTQMQPSALNHVVRVDVYFTSADGQHTCSDLHDSNNDQAAFFTAIEVSPTASPSDTAQPSGTSTCTPVIPTLPPFFQTPTATPKPRRTPPPGC